MNEAPAADELDQAEVAFAAAERAHADRTEAARDAFRGYQAALRLLRGGAPVVREGDERSGLEFLLAVPPDDVDPEALEVGVGMLRDEARALLEARVALRQRRVERGWRETVGFVAPGLVAIVLCVAGYTLAQRALQPIDLAEGKPWTASSAWAFCTPRAGRCGPLTSRILFHTKDDDSPWFRIDLGAPTTVSGATIINRTDDAPERAVPLLLEISDDDQVFREVARRDSEFSVWRPSFPPVQARYVRLRVPRKTWLHLEAVKLHP